jgi:hypothetical protein
MGHAKISMMKDTLSAAVIPATLANKAERQISRIEMEVLYKVGFYPERDGSGGIHVSTRAVFRVRVTSIPVEILGQS